MDYILRRLLGYNIVPLTVDEVKIILSDNDERDERILRAIINSSSLITQWKQEEQQSKAQTEFTKKIMAQILMNMTPCEAPEINLDEQIYQDQPESELLKSQLQYIYRLYKSTVRMQSGDGIAKIQDHIEEQLIKQSQINQCLRANCFKYSTLMTQGLDNVEMLHIKSFQILDQIRKARLIIQENKAKAIAKQMQISQKGEQIHRLKYTLEKLAILKDTFGSISLIDDDAEQIIPLMKQTQDKIFQHKLNDLQLDCVNINFFENKIELLKNQIKDGLYSVYLKFDETRYYSLFRSYFYLEKHYQMPPIISYAWLLAKKSIKVSFLNAMEQFQHDYTKALDEMLLIFLRQLFAEIIDQILNFHLCNRFHQNQQFKINNSEDEEQFQQYAETVRQTYLEMRQLIWAKLQKKLIKVLKQMENNIYQLSIEDFISMLGYICLLIKRAEDFSHSDTNVLCKYLQEVYKKYCDNFHAINIKTIATYLSNELYQRLPVQKDQKLNQQFILISGLKSVNKQLFHYLEPDRILGQNAINTEDNQLLFYLFEYQNPFKLQVEEFSLISKSIWNRKQVNVQYTSNAEMVLTSSSIHIIDLLFYYIALSFYNATETLRVQTQLIQLLELCVFVGFSQLVGNHQQHSLLDNFQQVLKFDENKELSFFQVQYDQFSENLIVQEQFCIFKTFIEKFTYYLHHFDLDIFQSRDKRPFIDITERGIAIEAIVFIQSMIKQGFNTLDMQINTAAFDEVFIQFKEFTYRAFMQNFIKIDGIIAVIHTIKWELKDIHGENHSLYIDRLIQFIVDQKDKLKSKGGGVIPVSAQKDIFLYLTEHCLYQIIENFSKIKKINSVGREQMSSEFIIICKEINNQVNIVSQHFIQKWIKYLRIFNNENYQEIDLYITQNRQQILLRLLLSLMVVSPSYNALPKQVKRNVIVKFYRDYYETFKLY